MPVTWRRLFSERSDDGKWRDMSMCQTGCREWPPFDHMKQINESRRFVRKVLEQLRRQCHWGMPEPPPFGRYEPEL